MPADHSRRRLKKLLATTGSWDWPAARSGATLLIYHRVGGGSSDERDLGVSDFADQIAELSVAPVVALDDAVDRLARGDAPPSAVITFDDGFGDVYVNAWPLLREHALPFTIYLATDYIGGIMHWDGSTATGIGPALTWDQIGEMVASGLCTVGNHTASHARPDRVDEDELDRCTEAIDKEIGVRPRHYADPWGVRRSQVEPALRSRFHTAATGRVGRNTAGVDLHRLRRVPVRRTDPIEFFRAKLAGALVPERAYGAIVRTAKVVGLRA